jgi:hypothetical protein
MKTDTRFCECVERNGVKRVILLRTDVAEKNETFVSCSMQAFRKSSVLEVTSRLPGVARVFIYPNLVSDRKRNEFYL